MRFTLFYLLFDKARTAVENPVALRKQEQHPLVAEKRKRNIFNDSDIPPANKKKMYAITYT